MPSEGAAVEGGREEEEPRALGTANQVLAPGRPSLVVSWVLREGRPSPEVPWAPYDGVAPFGLWAAVGAAPFGLWAAVGAAPFGLWAAVGAAIPGEAGTEFN